MQVSIRELKDHLSHYLHKVKAGETIIITSHHVPLATITVLPPVLRPTLRTLHTIEEVQWNGEKPTGAKKPPKIEGKTLSDYILEDRR